MDIAELRKKAKQGKTADAGSDVPDVPVMEQEVPSEDPAPAFAEPSVEFQENLVPEAVSEEVAAQGLDKLFGAETSLDLATVESYDSALAADAAAAEEAVRQYLAFNLGPEEYALDIRSIREIIKVREFTDVPRAPGFVLGIISLRGVVVPVFDLMVRLRLGQPEITSSSRIIVCQAGELVVGLLVDSINQVIKLGDDGIEPPPAVLSGLDQDFMTGIGRYQGRMVILLNIDNVLDVELN